MNRPRLARWLRITWTVCCGIAVVLLVALWVRSYWRTDIIRLATKKQVFSYLSSYGEIGLELAKNAGTPYWITTSKRIYIDSSAKMNSWEPDRGHPLMNLCGFRLRNYLLSSHSSRIFDFSLPFWFVFIAGIIFATLPWVRWSLQFGLRTALIITTLLAVATAFAVAFR
jgi:hypothetical protein